MSLLILFLRWQINQHNDDNSAAAKATAVSSADAKDKDKSKNKDEDKLTRVSVTLSRLGHYVRPLEEFSNKMKLIYIRRKLNSAFLFFSFYCISYHH
jgi:hypothetical protein